MSTIILLILYFFIRLAYNYGIFITIYKYQVHLWYRIRTDNVYFIVREKNGIAAALHSICDMELYCNIYKCIPTYIYSYDLTKYYHINNINFMYSNSTTEIKEKGVLNNEQFNVLDFDRDKNYTYKYVLNKQSGSIIKVCHEFADILLYYNSKYNNIHQYFPLYVNRTVTTSFYHRCFSKIIKPTLQITGIVQRIKSNIPHHCYLVGIQIRSFERKIWNAEPYITLIQKIINDTNMPNICMFISTDSSYIMSNILLHYPNITYHSNVGALGHVGGQTGQVTEDIALRSVIDLEVMKLCERLYISQYSGYGYLSLELVNTNIPVSIITKKFGIDHSIKELYNEPRYINNNKLKLLLDLNTKINSSVKNT